MFQNYVEVGLTFATILAQPFTLPRGIGNFFRVSSVLMPQ